MNLAFNIDYVYPMNTGIGRYGVELMKSCIELGIPTEVWMTQYMKSFDPISEEITARTVYYPWPRRMTDFFWPSLRARKKRIDWVHSANCDILPSSNSLRQVCMIHDLGPFMYGHMKTRQDTTIWRRRIQRAVSRAHCITVNSRSTMEDLLKYFPEASRKTFVTPLGIDHFQNSESRKGRGKHVLNVGTVEPRKNIDGLLRGYSILSQRGTVPPLVIAGKDGYRAEEYKRLTASLGIEDSVRFTGYISDSELMRLYSEAICLVHPAHHEGFGFTVPEAFRWQLPVAASSTGGIGEFFSDCIWPVDPEDPDSIAEGLAMALDSGATAEQMEARRRAASELTWRNCALKTLEALENV